MEKHDVIRENAQARRDAALAEAQRWQEFLKLYDQLCDQLGSASSVESTAHTIQFSELSTLSTRSRSRSRTGSRAAETEQLAREILLRAGRPLTTKLLLQEMEARGFKIGGQNPVANLHARLNRSSAIVFERPDGWRVREDPDATTAAATTVATATTVAAEHPSPGLVVDNADREGGDQNAL